MNKKTIYKLAGIAAIITAILIIPQFVLALFLQFKENSTLEAIELVFTIFVMIVALITLYGYYTIARLQKFKTLKIYSLISMAIVAVSVFHYFVKDIMWISVAALIIYGIIYILFGVALRKIKAIKYSNTLGWLYIVSGAFACTVFLAVLAPFLSIAISILEAKMFLGKAKEK
ncbi:MAG TPA: hypothetical protein VEC16_01260 [Alphaproteobacteria bacterium]|nr:hypothetical protein [Alphaproteobacteria bacterium]